MSDIERQVSMRRTFAIISHKCSPQAIIRFLERVNETEPAADADAAERSQELAKAKLRSRGIEVPE